MTDARSSGPATRPGRLHAFLRPRQPGGDLVAAAPRMAPRELVRRFWPFARPYRRAIAAGILLGVLLPGIQAAEIWMFGIVVDQVVVPAELGALPWIAAVVLGLTLAGAAAGFGEDYAWTVG